MSNFRDIKLFFILGFFDGALLVDTAAEENLR